MYQHCLLVNVTVEDFDEECPVWQLFVEAAGEDMEIDWEELQRILNTCFEQEFVFDGFGKEVCRSMVAMMDEDRTGKLGHSEFKTLWTDIQIWKNTFQKYDRDGSGALSCLELRSALHTAGYRVNFRTLKTLVVRYGDRQSTLDFDDFIKCAVQLKTMIEAFKKRDPDNTNEATFTLNEYFDRTLYC